MSRKKYSKELKLQLLKEHIENGVSYWKLGKDYGIEASIIRRWGYVYDTFGKEGLEKHNSDLCNYSADFKRGVVDEYLKGDISIQDLAYKYKIHAPSTVGSWIKQYNNHEELTNSRKEGVYHMINNNVRKNTTLSNSLKETILSIKCTDDPLFEKETPDNHFQRILNRLIEQGSNLLLIIDNINTLQQDEPFFQELISYDFNIIFTTRNAWDGCVDVDPLSPNFVKDLFISYCPKHKNNIIDSWSDFDNLFNYVSFIIIFPRFVYFKS